MSVSQAPILLLVALKNELEAISIPKSIPVAYTGIGKINAATVTQSAIAHYRPKLIVNFGTVGKINPALSELITIGKVIQRDMIAEPLAPRGVTPFCSKPAEYYSEHGQYTCGTGDSFVTSADPWLIRQSVDVVDMELFAIAAVAVAAVVSIAAVQLGFMLGGSIVIETVFALHGVGYLAWESISKNDFPVVQAVVLVVIFILLLILLLRVLILLLLVMAVVVLLILVKIVVLTVVILLLMV